MTVVVGCAASHPIPSLNVMPASCRRHASSMMAGIRPSRSQHNQRRENDLGAPVFKLGFIRVAERAAGRDAVAHEALQLLDLGETSLFLARPDKLPLDAHLEHAAGDV